MSIGRTAAEAAAQEAAATLTFYRRRGKRVLDITVALVAIVIFSIPFLSIMAVNFVLYRQVFYVGSRVRRSGETFAMVKFLSMIDDKETKFGGFLRYTALDELPQLFHVLVGHMSLIGPRPHTIEQYERLSLISGYRFREALRPGMTGMAQLRGHTDSDDTRQQLVTSDAEYVSRCSLLVDLGILVRTFAVFFTGH